MGISPFFREQLDEMTGENRRNYRSIVSRSWKEITEDPARLSIYHDRAIQMKNEAEKAIKLGDDSSVSRTKQHEKTMAKGAAVKGITETAPESTKVPRFCSYRLGLLR